ncbi:unnamed protein product [Camellia sinensis]
MMKRAFVNLHQSHAVDGEARAKLQHHTLLQEYLQLQKEFVLKKRKLQTTKQKRDTLLAEVRFLRRRRRYLLKIQSPKLKLKEDLVQPQNSDMPRKILGKRKNLRKKMDCSVNAAAMGSPYTVLVPNSDTRIEEEEGKEREQIGKHPLRLGKKSRKLLTDDKRVGKKKISWQDQMPLEV